MADSQVSAEELEQVFAAEEPAPEPEPTQEELPEQEAAEEPEPEGEPAAEEAVTIEGRQFSPEQLQPFVRFAEWAEQNPQVWEQIQALEGQPYASQPAAETEQEWEDPNDRLARIEGQLQALVQERQAVSKHEFIASLNEAEEQFRSKHPELDEEGMERVIVKLRDLNILPTYRERFPARPVSAAVAALEDAFRIEFFDRGPARQPVTTSEARARRRAASAAPSGATAAREPEIPTDPFEKKQAMIAEIREAQQA